MSRILEALKSLENRRPAEPPSAPAPEPPPIRVLDELLASYEAPAPRTLAVPTSITPDLPSARKSLECCTLPTVEVVPECYLELALRAGEQLASSYCNVLLFVTPNHAAEACFSTTQLAQAFVLQSGGDVLLVDGDLRFGRLSKTVCPTGAGMTEAMLGAASWPEVIRRTTAPRIDFVPCGNSQIPTFERTDFGWGALRPKYRVVLIGAGDAQEPETRWLASRCDGVYLVISRRLTRRQEASVAVNDLRSGGANVLGCVVADD